MPYDNPIEAARDQGSADAYYGRHRQPRRPEWVEAHYETITLTDPAEIDAYNKGFDETFDRKDFGE
jgi:hypothetical protein